MDTHPTNPNPTNPHPANPNPTNPIDLNRTVDYLENLIDQYGLPPSYVRIGWQHVRAGDRVWVYGTNGYPESKAFAYGPYTVHSQENRAFKSSRGTIFMHYSEYLLVPTADYPKYMASRTHPINPIHIQIQDDKESTLADLAEIALTARDFGQLTGVIQLWERVNHRLMKILLKKQDMKALAAFEEHPIHVMFFSAISRFDNSGGYQKYAEALEWCIKTTKENPNE